MAIITGWSGRVKVQSPYLYLQSAGSDSSDGSARGHHLRWDLLRNLGDNHIPKGNLAGTTHNFNRANDFVHVYRVKYPPRFPTLIPFSVAPDIVNDAARLWIYLAASTNTATTVYVYFRDTARYDAVRASIDPATNPLDFVRAYGGALIEVMSPDKLFFAAEVAVDETGPNTTLRAEAISVVENVPLPERFVSCRRTYTHSNWCQGAVKGDPKGTDLPVGDISHVGMDKAAPSPTVYVPSCCAKGENFVADGDFEQTPSNFMTDYVVGGVEEPGHVFVTHDASTLNGRWNGLPFTGKNFLAVDGSKEVHKAAWRTEVKTRESRDFCFSFQLCTLFEEQPAVILAEARDISGNLLASQTFTAPAVAGQWQFCSMHVATNGDPSIILQIFSLDPDEIGNDFGLDQMWLCEARPLKCAPRIVSENIHSIRFDIQDGHARGVLIETYEDFIKGADWAKINEFALTKTTATAHTRLEDAAYPIDGRWQKFNDYALVRTANYKDKWARAGGIRQGVTDYISLSNTDPQAMATLPGADPADGSVEVSYLSMLKLAALDFHVARMLGLGHIDAFGQPDEAAYIHLAVYDTYAALDDGHAAAPTRHLYMTIPTTPKDYRLPAVPALQSPPLYGLYTYNAGLQPSPITDAGGYTPDGMSRFITLFMDYEEELPDLGPFFVPSDEFCAVQKTNPVFFGIEYMKQGASHWQRPELSNDPNYLDWGNPPIPETIPIPNNGNELQPIFVHQETENGIHLYAPYAVNWFSRASEVGTPVSTDLTTIIKPNRLLPPANFKVHLVQEESPRLLTTQDEQDMYGGLAGPDMTLVRVTFDYFHTHDLNHDFGDQVEVLWREDLPRNVRGAVKSVVDIPGTNQVTLRTKSYVNNSTGLPVTPSLAGTLMANFEGGVFSSGGKNFLIVDVNPSVVVGEGPIFILEKIEVGSPADPNGTGQFVTVITYEAPAVDDTFMALENMAEAGNWGAANPLSKVIQIGDASWAPVTESYVQDGETITQTLRGFWKNATIVDLPDVNTGSLIGVYQLTFPGFSLGHHSQHADADPVEWHNGVVRIHKASDPGGPRKVLEVISTTHIGDGQPLVLVAVDATFDVADPIQSGAGVNVNYYPGYRAYLHTDAAHNLDESHTLPASGELTRKTLMGGRSVDSTLAYRSAVGVPAPLIAMGITEPLPPEGPSGGDYATRPDFYFKSTYSFQVQFAHEPYMAAFYRASDDTLLRALYNEATVAQIKADLKALGGESDPYRADRWKNLVSFDYVYDDPGKPYYDATGTNPNGTFRRFPREAGNYRFPKPNIGGALDGTKEPGEILDDVKAAIWKAFLPLTEQPLLYKYIKGGTYQPLPIPQKIKDATGNVLPDTDPAFAQAPMAKRTGTNAIQFTDFTLDGSSNSIWFYFGVEIGSLGKISEPSPISGPVYLINTRPPDAPGIKQVVTIPPGTNPATSPKIIFELNGYPVEQRVGQFRIYRATDAVAALSVRTMTLVNTVDLETEGWVEAPALRVEDDFEGEIVPYGDPLYYRIIAARKVTNADGDTEWAPSQPSKLLLTTVIDSINPVAPELAYTSDPIAGSPAVLQNVSLSWDTTCYNGTYFLEKLTGGGAWTTIYSVKTNAATVNVGLASTTLASSTLDKEDTAENWPIYHRFRVRVMNSSGLFNVGEKEKTI